MTVPKKLKTGNKKRLIIGSMCIFLIIAMIVGLCVYFLMQKQEIIHNLPEVKVAEVKRQDIEINIGVSGILQCARQQDFYSRTASVVKEIRKKEGSKVTIGEVILLLDNSQALVELGEVESTLAVLESDYLQGVSDKVLLMKKRDEAKKNLKQFEALYQTGEATLREVEIAQLAVEDIENKITAINLSALESQVNKERLAVQAAREQLAATVITSPFEGTVLKMAVNQGKPVNKNEFLFSVGKPDALEVGVSVNEYDAVKLQKGQQVVIRSEAIKGKEFSAHISQIAPLAEAEITTEGNKENKVKAKIVLDEKTNELKPGFSVNVDILLEKRANVLVAPIEAVIARDESAYVFVYADGVTRLQEIQKGVAVGSEQEITAGLKEGEIVIVEPSEQLAHNMQVKVAENQENLVRK